MGSVGEIKKIVSLIDRTAFDEYIYPASTTHTHFQPDDKTYNNFTQEIVNYTISGNPQWGQRLTFNIPWPWKGDFLNWIALRLKPLSWLPLDAAEHLGPNRQDWIPTDPEKMWVWANSLGSAAIELAEMEVDGVVIESFSGDWSSVWNRISGDSDQLLSIRKSPSHIISEDGYLYCYLPFWFSKYKNTAFPLCSCGRPDMVKFHIKLRPFSEVVRRLSTALNCDESLLGDTMVIRDYTFPFRAFKTIQNNKTIPGFEIADIICEISNIDGELRDSYIKNPQEILMSPVIEMDFWQPLKYTIGVAADDIINIQLPLTAANGPIKQILFFIRRKAAIDLYREYDNYSATILEEADTIWNPIKPLLVKGKLMVGTATWVDEDELWWRTEYATTLPGGIRSAGNFIYGYNFADNPLSFEPTGSVNASRVDMRLDLSIKQPSDSHNKEWTVHVFIIGTNWIRFQNGIANLLFMD